MESRDLVRDFRETSDAAETIMTGKRKNILVIHGPNLNLLGTREVEVYGDLTLAEINRRVAKVARECGAAVRFFQSNGEGELIDFLHRQRRWADAVVDRFRVPTPTTRMPFAMPSRESLCPRWKCIFPISESASPFSQVGNQARVFRTVPGLGWASYAEGVRLLARLLSSPQTKPKPRP